MISIFRIQNAKTHTKALSVVLSSETGRAQRNKAVETTAEDV